MIAATEGRLMKVVLSQDSAQQLSYKVSGYKRWRILGCFFTTAVGSAGGPSVMVTANLAGDILVGSASAYNIAAGDAASFAFGVQLDGNYKVVGGVLEDGSFNCVPMPDFWIDQDGYVIVACGVGSGWQGQLFAWLEVVD